MSNNKRNNKRSRGSFAAAGTSSTTSSSSAPSRARKVGRGHPGYAYFEREMHPVLKPLNKLYNFPSWAMNPKHAETDRSLMLRKVLVGRERLVAHTALDVFRGCCTALDVFRGCLVLREVLGSRELTETV